MGKDNVFEIRMSNYPKFIKHYFSYDFKTLE